MRSKATLEKRGEKLLAALRACGPGWHSRAEIAKALGKTKPISSFDASALDLLVETGQIESERREIAGPIPQRWEYRLVEKANSEDKS